MRIAYLLVINLGVYDGVIQKIVSQVNSWKHYNHEVQVFCVTPDPYEKSSLYTSNVKINTYVEGGNHKKVKNYLFDILKLSEFHQRVEKDLQHFNPEIVYVRNTFYQPFIGRLIKRYKAVYEYNTSEKREFKILSKKLLKYKIAYVYYLVFYRAFFKAFKGVVCVTYELENEFKSKINSKILSEVIPNAIDLKSTVINSTKHRTNKLPSLLFIGTPGGISWHGLDQIEELAKQTIGKLNFHIIGFENNNDQIPNVKYYGFLLKNEYQQIFDKCDIGIGTVALYRKGMNEACPLKVREYLANGMPIIICYKDTAFKDNPPEWVLRLPNEKNSLTKNKNKIISFCLRNKGSRLETDSLRPYISSLLYEKKRLEFLQKVRNSFK